MLFQYIGKIKKWNRGMSTKTTNSTNTTTINITNNHCRWISSIMGRMCYIIWENWNGEIYEYTWEIWKNKYENVYEKMKRENYIYIFKFARELNIYLSTTTNKILHGQIIHIYNFVLTNRAQSYNLKKVIQFCCLILKLPSLLVKTIYFTVSCLICISHFKFLFKYSNSPVDS